MAAIALIITLAGARFYGGVIPARIAGFIAAASGCSSAWTSSLLPPGLLRVSLLLPATHSTRAFAGLGMGDAAQPALVLSLCVLAVSALLSFALAALLFEWDSRASQPSRKAFAAILGIAPYVAAALIGV